MPSPESLGRSATAVGAGARSCRDERTPTTPADDARGIAAAPFRRADRRAAIDASRRILKSIASDGSRIRGQQETLDALRQLDSSPAPAPANTPRRNHPRAMPAPAGPRLRAAFRDAGDRRLRHPISMRRLEGRSRHRHVVVPASSRRSGVASIGIVSIAQWRERHPVNSEPSLRRPRRRRRAGTPPRLPGTPLRPPPQGREHARAGTVRASEHAAPQTLGWARFAYPFCFDQPRPLPREFKPGGLEDRKSIRNGFCRASSSLPVPCSHGARAKRINPSLPSGEHERGRGSFPRRPRPLRSRPIRSGPRGERTASFAAMRSPNSALYICALSRGIGRYRGWSPTPTPKYGAARRIDAGSWKSWPRKRPLRKNGYDCVERSRRSYSPFPRESSARPSKSPESRSTPCAGAKTSTVPRERPRARGRSRSLSVDAPRRSCPAGESRRGDRDG